LRQYGSRSAPKGGKSSTLKKSRTRIDFERLSPVLSLEHGNFFAQLRVFLTQLLQFRRLGLDDVQQLDDAVTHADREPIERNRQL
jgi:hypothetical protein